MRRNAVEFVEINHVRKLFLGVIFWVHRDLDASFDNAVLDVFAACRPTRGGVRNAGVRYECVGG